MANVPVGSHDESRLPSLDDELRLLRQQFEAGASRWPMLECYLLTWPESEPAPTFPDHWTKCAVPSGPSEAALRYSQLFVGTIWRDSPRHRYRTGSCGALVVTRDFGRLFGDFREHDEPAEAHACGQQFKDLSERSSRCLADITNLSNDTMSWAGHTRWLLALFELLDLPSDNIGNATRCRSSNAFLDSSTALSRLANQAKAIAADKQVRNLIFAIDRFACSLTDLNGLRPGKRARWFGFWRGRVRVPRRGSRIARFAGIELPEYNNSDPENWGKTAADQYFHAIDTVRDDFEESSREIRALVSEGVDRWLYQRLGMAPGQWTSNLLAELKDASSVYRRVFGSTSRRRPEKRFGSYANSDGVRLRVIVERMKEYIVRLQNLDLTNLADDNLRRFSEPYIGVKVEATEAADSGRLLGFHTSDFDATADDNTGQRVTTEIEFNDLSVSEMLKLLEEGSGWRSEWRALLKLDAKLELQPNMTDEVIVLRYNQGAKVAKDDRPSSATVPDLKKARRNLKAEVKRRSNE